MLSACSAGSTAIALTLPAGAAGYKTLAHRTGRLVHFSLYYYMYFLSTQGTGFGAVCARLCLSAASERARYVARKLRQIISAALRDSCYKETQCEGGRHEQELQQETMKGTRTGE